MVTDRSRRLEALESGLARRSGATAPLPTLTVPNVVEWVISGEYLGMPLYPRQATILKVVSLAEDLLTAFDYEVIGEWEDGFSVVQDETGARYEGRRGAPPGILDRMAACRAMGRSTCAELVLVLGRRAGKGYLASLLVTHLLWRLLALGEPQRALGIDPRKELLVMSFAADLSQAQSNVFRDVAERISTTPCFQPFLASRTASTVRLRTPAELAGRPDGEGSLVVQARASTPSSGRGPSAVGFVFDEMSFAGADGQHRGADAVYEGPVLPWHSSRTQ